MSGYAIAWLVVVGAAGLGAWLAFVLLRRFRHLRFLGAGLVLAWAITPYSFDGEHAAPALAVAVFRLLFEAGAPWRVPLALASASTLGVLAAYFVGIGIAAIASRRRVPVRQSRRQPMQPKTG